MKYNTLRLALKIEKELSTNKGKKLTKYFPKEDFHLLSIVLAELAIRCQNKKLGASFEKVEEIGRESRLFHYRVGYKMFSLFPNYSYITYTSDPQIQFNGYIQLCRDLSLQVTITLLTDIYNIQFIVKNFFRYEI